MGNDQWLMGNALRLYLPSVRLTVSEVVHSLPTIPQVQRIPAVLPAFEIVAKDD